MGLGWEVGVVGRGSTPCESERGGKREREEGDVRSDPAGGGRRGRADGREQGEKQCKLSVFFFWFFWFNISALGVRGRHRGHLSHRRNPT